VSDRDDEFDARAAQLQAALAEYETLRAESTTAISNRVTVANFTFGALAIIIAGLLSDSTPGLVAGLVAVIFVPQLSKTGLLIWLGEYDRSQRVGRWIRDLEARINDLVGGRAMGWESGLMSGNTHMSYPYASTALLLLGSGWISAMVGLGIVFQATSALEDVRSWALLGALTAFSLGTEAWFAVFFRRKWSSIRVFYAVPRQGP